ncbi:MAG: hypothetical protein ACXAC7_04950 [Candidatus Hodarchaeales archaeon]|jgi:DNA-binding MarR family transcriptional regulator
MSEINIKMLQNAEIILNGTPKSVRTVFEIIRKASRPIRVTEIQKVAGLTDRTIRLALRRLYTLNLVVKIPDIYDLRSHYLTLSRNLAIA